MMKRKNVTTGLLTIMVIVLSFGISAWGQINIIVDPKYPPDRPGYPMGVADEYAGNLGVGHCAECIWKAAALGKVPTPTTETTTGTINQPGTTTTTELYPFDFDGEAWILNDDSADPNQPVGFGPYGYCSGDNVEWEVLNTKEDVNKNPAINNKFLFDVCGCPEACEVMPGTRVGIEMLIDADGNFDTHDDGVYFADPGLNKIYFNIIDTQQLPEDKHRLTENEEPCRDTEMTPVGDEDTRSFDLIRYYRSYTERKSYKINESDEKSLYKVNMGASGVPLDGPMKTSIPANNRVVALRSDLAGGYVFKDIITDLNKYCLLWIDIPALRIDPTKASSLKGSTIRLRVRLLFNEEDNFICDDCNPPDYCECIVEVATIGCDVTPDDPDNCMFFPYVIQNLDPWGTGISVTARNDTLPAGAYCILTVADSAGNTASYRKDGVSRIWTFMMDGNMMSNFAMTNGTALIPGPVSLNVNTNYPIHGYSFLTDGTFGAGTLPVGCNPGQCSP